ncbi:hypothetical protein [Salinicola rhizosphaerae]|uniref:Nucleotidyltransferase n=1 Tax=Salinicola rhizosphaerae TaxID=1443141 RepID=A0ABQ3EC70_9GAMM|nr:hypothetical protein [Salinicola rhizosphaerae]GHB32980.1 hypothetical protein GCM10009038_34920 [Salinicola rhizosphaerae]
MSAREQLDVALELISELAPEDQCRLVLIGGQAISFWAHFLFGDGTFTVREDQVLTSSDLDIVTDDEESIKILARSWNGAARFSELGDHTPNRALIQVPHTSLSAGYNYTVDVMGDVYGATAKELVKSSAEIEWDYRGTPIRFRVVSPEMLLWTRIANVGYGRMGAAKNRRDIERAKVLCRIVHEDIMQHAYEIASACNVDAKKEIKRQIYRRAAFVYRDIAKRKITRKVFADFPEIIGSYDQSIPKTDFLSHELYSRAIPGWSGWLHRKVHTIWQHREHRAKEKRQ